MLCDSLTYRNRKPFIPFENHIWWSLLGVLLYAALVMWLIEGWTNPEDFPDRGSRGVSKSVFMSLQSFFGSNDHRFTPLTFGGRICVLGVSFLTLVMLSTYTAQITTFLVTQTEDRGTVTSLEQAVQQRRRVCSLQAMAENMRLLHPKLFANELYEATANAGESMGTMRKLPVGGLDEGAAVGSCSIAIVTEDEFRKLQSQHEEHCDKIFVGTEITSFANALAVRSDLQAAMSWAVTGALATNKYAELAKAAKDRLVPESICRAGDDNVDFLRLSWGAALGPMMVSVLFTTVALIGHVQGTRIQQDLPLLVLTIAVCISSQVRGVGVRRALLVNAPARTRRAGQRRDAAARAAPRVRAGARGRLAAGPRSELENRQENAAVSQQGPSTQQRGAFGPPGQCDPSYPAGHSRVAPHAEGGAGGAHRRDD